MGNIVDALQCYAHVELDQRPWHEGERAEGSGWAGNVTDAVKHSDTRRAFGWLPDQWARDPQISDACLCILAYRCTFANDMGAFGLWEDCLSKTPILAKGFGEGVRARAIAEAVKASLLHRPHNSKLPRGPGYTFARPHDRLNLPDEHLDGTDSRKVWRSWFTGALPCKEMAALLFLRAGTGKGRGVYARELEDRFDWSQPTALSTLRGLRSRGIVVMERRRGAKGCLDGVVYVVSPDLGMLLPAAASEETTSHKKSSHGTATRKKPSHGFPGDGQPPDGLPSDIRRTPLHAPPSEDLPKRKEEYTSRLAAGGSIPSLEKEEALGLVQAKDVEERAWQSSKILGWIGDRQLRDDWDDVASELVEQVGQALDDQELAALVKTSTAGRVHESILSPAGCYGVRYLAAWLLAKEDGVSPEDALERVLQAMRDRIGSREGEWLNSLALLGQRFDGETCEGDRFYAAGVSAADITKQLGIGRSDARRDDDDVVHASSTSSPCRRVGQPE